MPDSRKEIVDRIRSEISHPVTRDFIKFFECVEAELLESLVTAPRDDFERVQGGIRVVRKIVTDLTRVPKLSRYDNGYA